MILEGILNQTSNIDIEHDTLFPSGPGGPEGPRLPRGPAGPAAPL